MHLSGVGSSGFTALACKCSQYIVNVPRVLHFGALVVPSMAYADVN